MGYLTHNSEAIKAKNDSLPSLPEIDLLPFELISKPQMNKALIYFDALTKVESALVNASADTQQAWQNAKKFNREDAFLNEIAQKARITDLQLDFIFEIGITM